MQDCILSAMVKTNYIDIYKEKYLIWKDKSSDFFV